MGTFLVGTLCVLIPNQSGELFLAQLGQDSPEILWEAAPGYRGAGWPMGASWLDSASQPEMPVTKPGAQGSPLISGVSELMALYVGIDRAL